MKKLFTMALLAATLGGCQKETTNMPALEPKAAAIALITIEGLTGVCNAVPFLYPTPGVKIYFSAYTNSMVLANPGNIVVWMRPAGASTWSSKTVTTPTANPVSVSYASCSPAMGSIAPGMLMELKVSQPGGINMSATQSFFAVNCVIGPR